jgi:UDP-glucose 4-epimerase
MNILIIGSDSFIGGCFINKYGSVHNLRAVSRVSTGLTQEFVVENLFEMPESLLENQDVVMNFTAIVHRPDLKDDEIYEEVNRKLALNIANKAKTNGASQFIQMSTIAVYGRHTSITRDTPCDPDTPYGISKLHADQDLLKLNDAGFSVAVIRPPMVYGGGLAPGNMLRLIKLADKGIPLPFKAIDNKRDFVNVANLVQYLNLAAENKLKGVYLISDNEPVSTEYLLLKIFKYLGKPVSVFRLPSIILYLIKLLRPAEYEKLFGSLLVEPNFPFESSVTRYTVDQGLREMVNEYLNS